MQGFTPLETIGRQRKEMMSLTGFTIVEALITALIFSFLVVGITGVLNIANLSYSVDFGLLDLQQQVRLALDWMSRELRGASSLSISGSNDRLTFNTLTESNIQYYRDALNNRVMRQAGTSRILGNDITTLTFCCWHDATCDATCTNSNVLQIQVGGSKTAMQKTLSFSLSEKVNLRNE